MKGQPVWMSSFHVKYRLYQIGPNDSEPAILLDKLEGGYNDAHARLTSQDLRLEFHLDGRMLVQHYRIGEHEVRIIKSP